MQIMSFHGSSVSSKKEKRKKEKKGRNVTLANVEEKKTFIEGISAAVQWREFSIVRKCKWAARNLVPVNINKIRLVSSGNVSYFRGAQIKFGCEIHAHADSAQSWGHFCWEERIKATPLKWMLKMSHRFTHVARELLQSKTVSGRDHSVNCFIYLK